jgi:hypothetical protein
MEEKLEKITTWLESDKFDNLCWWIIGLSFSYFVIRTIVSIVWNV